MAGIVTCQPQQLIRTLTTVTATPSTSTPRRQSPSPISSSPSPSHAFRHAVASTFVISSSTVSTSRRSASSSSSSSSTAAAAAAARSDGSGRSLTWNQFLQLRKVRRRYNLIASASTGLSTAFTGAGYLTTIDLNQLSGVLFGIDPFMALGVSTLACGALGWLIGPLAGSAVFNMMHKANGPEMLAKEKDFYHRIGKYRADISAAGNAQNTPFPDYYGEKIDSVAAYRQWLRDQRKFAKKREYREK